MSLVFAGIAPHPPIIVPEVGKSNIVDVQMTVEAMSEWAREMVAAKPETIIVISPHGPVFRDAIAINGSKKLRGTLACFGAPHVEAAYDNNLALANDIAKLAKEKGVSAAVINEELSRRLSVDLQLDHGTMVPLYYLQKAGFKGRLVSIAMGMLPREELFIFGQALAQAVEEQQESAVLVASGDLSHRLTKEAPAGYSPQGQAFDQSVLQVVKEWDVDGLLRLDENLCEAAGECGYRPLLILAGALEGLKVDSQVLSYEGPFGVGYLVACLRIASLKAQENKSQRVERYLQDMQAASLKLREKESLLVGFARRTLEAYVRKEPLPQIPQGLRNEPSAGAFVSIKKRGELRGCIGTIAPTQSTFGEEIRQNAISAGTKDPRFFPVEEDELAELQYSVDVLGSEEKIDSVEDLDPQRYGVIVRSGRKQGLLLPMLEGIDTPEDQIQIASEKAGIRSGEPISLSRFEVIRYK